MILIISVILNLHLFSLFTEIWRRCLFPKGCWCVPAFIWMQELLPVFRFTLQLCNEQGTTAYPKAAIFLYSFPGNGRHICECHDQSPGCHPGSSHYLPLLHPVMLSIHLIFNTRQSFRSVSMFSTLTGYHHLWPELLQHSNLLFTVLLLSRSFFNTSVGASA